MNDTRPHVHEAIRRLKAVFPANNWRDAEPEWERALNRYPAPAVDHATAWAIDNTNGKFPQISDVVTVAKTWENAHRATQDRAAGQPAFVYHYDKDGNRWTEVIQPDGRSSRNPGFFQGQQ